MTLTTSISVAWSRASMSHGLLRTCRGMFVRCTFVTLTAMSSESARELMKPKVRKVTMAKITGVGGVFFKSKGNSAALAAWYRKHLGLPLEDFGGAILRWPEDKAEDRGLTVWHLAEKDSQWFSPSKSSFMINYRVDKL